MARKKTHEEYIKEIAKINSNIEVVGEYVNNCTKILHRCKIDGHEWYPTPKQIIRGQGCPKCYGNVKKTHEKYVKEVEETNPNIEVIGEYVNNHTPILHRCKIDEYEWLAKPYNVLHGYGCPMCAKNIKMTHAEYISRLKEYNPNIEVIDEYQGSNIKILHKCKKDNNQWYATPWSLLHRNGCPKCAKNARYGHDEYVEKVTKINHNIKVVEQRINDCTKILHKCRKCGNEWKVSPTSILQGSGCPKCNQSRGEREIEEYLNKHNIEYVYQYTFDECKNVRPLPFDFYLPSINTCIEYDGEQHYKPINFFGGLNKFKKNQYNDSIKNQYCKDNNITLLRIKYDENAEKILDNFLYITT